MCLNCLTWICNSYRNTDLISGKILGHMHTTVTVACWKLKVKLQSVPRRTEPSCEDTETPLFQMCLKTQSSTSAYLQSSCLSFCGYSSTSTGRHSSSGKVFLTVPPRDRQSQHLSVSLSFIFTRCIHPSPCFNRSVSLYHFFFLS